MQAAEAATAYWPYAQTPQTLEVVEGALGFSGAAVPTGQLVHAAPPGVAWYVPAPHASQLDRPLAALNWPGAHGVQLSAPNKAKAPALHGVHAPAPAAA